MSIFLIKPLTTWLLSTTTSWCGGFLCNLFHNAEGEYNFQKISQEVLICLNADCECFHSYFCRWEPCVHSLPTLRQKLAGWMKPKHLQRRSGPVKQANCSLNLSKLLLKRYTPIEFVLENLEMILVVNIRSKLFCNKKSNDVCEWLLLKSVNILCLVLFPRSFWVNNFRFCRERFPVWRMT